MITLKLTQKQIDLVKHVLYNGYLVTGEDAYLKTRDSINEQASQCYKRAKRKPVMKTFEFEGHKFHGTMEEALQGISGFENDPSGFKPDLLTWCKDNLTEIK